MAATYLGKKTYSTNHLRCFQQVNIFPHPSYQPYVHHKFSCFYFDYYLGILPFSLSPVYSSFPQLRGSAFICWIYYRDLILFVGLAPGEKVAFNWEQWTTSVVSDNLENIKIQELQSIKLYFSPWLSKFANMENSASTGDLLLL